jgi:hypothetical protein
VAIEPCSCQTKTGKKCIIHAEGNVEKSELWWAYEKHHD